MPSSTDRKRVLLAYHFFPHYRRAVLKALLERESEFDWTLAAGEHYKGKLKLLSHAELSAIAETGDGTSQFLPLENRVFAKHFILQPGLVQHIKANSYDAVVLFGSYSILTYWRAARLAASRGMRVLFWTHGVYGNERFLHGLVRRQFLRLAKDGLLLYGHHARDLLIEDGFSPEKLYVIGNSLDWPAQLEMSRTITNERIEAERNRLFRDPQCPTLMFLGRLTRRKHLQLLLKAIHTSEQRGRKLNCLIVGDGDDRSELEALSQSLGISDRVVFAGECYDERALATYLSMADICVSPGDVGLLAMHSLAYGTPVITHADKSRQMPEFEAIEPGVTGAFFRFGDVEDLVQVIEQFLQTVPAREIVRQRCQDRIASRFSPEWQTDVILHALRGLPASKLPDHN